jgi:hypothetical protein
MAAAPGVQPQASRRRVNGTVQCWAHSRVGWRCQRAVAPREGEPSPIPYCERHLQAGDGALRVVNHPVKALGKVLVARLPLPVGYQMCFWGDRTLCPYTFEDDRTLQYKSGKQRKHPNGVIDPSRHPGSLLQFMSSPGVEELQTVRSCSGPGAYFGTHNGARVGQRCRTVMSVPAGTQLAFHYGAEWFTLRGLSRVPVGTQRYPLPVRTASTSACATKAAVSRRAVRWEAERTRWQQLWPLLQPLMEPGGRKAARTFLELGCSPRQP